MPLYMLLCQYRQKASMKKHCARGGLTNEGRHNLALLHKQAHDKRGVAESMHVYITRDRFSWVGHMHSSIDGRTGLK